MKTIAFIKWLLKPWPIFLPIILGSIHYSLYWNLSIDFTQINKYVSLLLQVIGCFLVLYNINSSIGTFNEGNMLRKIANYFSSCPLLKKVYHLHPDGITSSVSIGGPTLFTGKKTTSDINERLTNIEIQIEELKKYVSNISSEIMSETHKLVESKERKIGRLNQELDKIRLQIKDSIIGGIELQVFGIGLVIYGSCISIW